MLLVCVGVQTVSVWGSGGRIELTVAKFMALQKAVQPAWYQSMADGETWPSDTSRKRVRKSVDRTLAHLDQCLLLHLKTQAIFFPPTSSQPRTLLPTQARTPSTHL